MLVLEGECACGDWALRVSGEKVVVFRHGTEDFFCGEGGSTAHDAVVWNSSTESIDSDLLEVNHSVAGSAFPHETGYDA